MSATRAGLAALALLFAGPAHAHVIIEGYPGWQGGLLHPFFVPAHALFLTGLALLIGQQTKPHRIILTLLFPLALVAATGLVTQAYSSNNADLFLLICSTVAGLLVALGFALPLAATAPLLVAGALSLLFDSVPALPSIRETLEVLFATILSASLAMALLAWITAERRRLWQQIGARIAGSWIAASAILVLAQRFAG